MSATYTAGHPYQSYSVVFLRTFVLKVNFLGYWGHAPDGSLTHFARVTDIPIDKDILITLCEVPAHAGKSRTRPSIPSKTEAITSGTTSVTATSTGAPC